MYLNVKKMNPGEIYNKLSDLYKESAGFEDNYYSLPSYKREFIDELIYQMQNNFDNIICKIQSEIDESEHCIIDDLEY